MLPYAGIATFARAPQRELDGAWRADTAVLGIPFDIALGFRPGARFAPRAIREASLRYALPPEGFYDLATGRQRLAGPTLADAGDVNLPSLEPELARERITRAASELRERCRLPVFLGGDHSVSYPVLRAYADEPELHVVQVDAHLDFTDERNGTRHSNSSPFRRAAEELPGLRHVTTLGLRGLRFDREAVEAARARGHTLVPADEVREDRHLGRLPEGKRVYLSLDADALDPAVLPATSSPEPDGLSFSQVLRIIRETARRNDVVGFDLVELTPNLDPSGNSALLAARLVMEAIAAVLDP
ncbi:MAG TPA: arginase family protein [Deinococcales bacterium]|nr:arginase family protein [Deinococcales bacterium]